MLNLRSNDGLIFSLGADDRAVSRNAATAEFPIVLSVAEYAPVAKNRYRSGAHAHGGFLNTDTPLTQTSCYLASPEVSASCCDCRHGIGHNRHPARRFRFLECLRYPSYRDSSGDEHRDHMADHKLSPAALRRSADYHPVFSEQGGSSLDSVLGFELGGRFMLANLRIADCQF